MKLKMIVAAVLATAAFGANAGGLLGSISSTTFANGVVTPAAASPSLLGSVSSTTFANGVVTQPAASLDLRAIANVTVANGQVSKVQPQPIPAAMKAKLGGLVAQ